MKIKKFSTIIFPEEREIVIENTEQSDITGKIISRALKKEILMLYKLGLDEYEIKYLLALKQKKEFGEKWRE